jgi:predicted HicB family RNase H-like nuclease
MSSTLTYKGFAAAVRFSAEDEAFIGHLAGINDIVGFHAETVPDLISAFHEAVDDYIETCAQVGKTPEKAYSGKLMVRIDPAVHARAARAAELSGRSLAQWTEDVLREAARLPEAVPTRKQLDQV